MGYTNDNDFQIGIDPGSMQPKNLKQHQYTISLINEALRTGLLSVQEIINIQNNVMLVLQNLIWRYTQGESSSVTSETAESILTSIIYAVDVYFKGLESPEAALEYLKKSNIHHAHDEGVRMISTLLEESKQLYKVIRTNKLDISVDAYNTTIDEALPIFMKKYEIIFDAPNTMASIDYPLAIDDMKLQGILYIHQYLQRLQLETEFCKLFNIDDLRELLVNYGQVCRFNYQIELFNIYELVLNNAVFAIVSEGSLGQILLSSHQSRYLESKFATMTSDQISHTIHTAIVQLQNGLGIQNAQTKEYMAQSAEVLIKRIIHTVPLHHFHALIITCQEKVTKPISFSLNSDSRMSDLELRKWLAEIAELESKEKKAEFIQTRFFSLVDYLDLFRAGILYDDEYDAIFAFFSDMELAVWARVVFHEASRTDRFDIYSIVQDYKNNEGEEWKVHYIQFMKRLDHERLQSIEQMLQKIDYEEFTYYG